MRTAVQQDLPLVGFRRCGPRGETHKRRLEVLALHPQPRRCIVCDGLIDPHPGTGRKPHTCGTVQCVRVQRNMCAWRIRNRNSRTSMVERLKREGAM